MWKKSVFNMVPSFTEELVEKNKVVNYGNIGVVYNTAPGQGISGPIDCAGEVKQIAQQYWASIVSKECREEGWAIKSQEAADYLYAEGEKLNSKAGVGLYQ